MVHTSCYARYVININHQPVSHHLLVNQHHHQQLVRNHHQTASFYHQSRNEVKTATVTNIGSDNIYQKEREANNCFF